MLRFFRQLRQRLLTENKFSRYLLYAFGEILLVVIGILIALQVNNWNEERKTKKELNTILIDVYKDLKNDQEELSQRLQGYNDFVANIHYLQQNASHMSMDSLAYRISELHRVTAFQAVQFGYKKLNNNPNTDLAPADLINELSLYYSNFGSGTINNTNSEFLSTYSLNLLREFLIDYGFPLAAPFVAPAHSYDVYGEIIQSRRFWGIVRNMEYNWGIHRFGFETARERVQENLSRLESHFKNHNMAYPENQSI